MQIPLHLIREGFVFGQLDDNLPKRFSVHVFSISKENIYRRFIFEHHIGDYGFKRGTPVEDNADGVFASKRFSGMLSFWEHQVLRSRRLDRKSVV